MAFSVFNYLTSFYGKSGDALIGREALTNMANWLLGSTNGLVALAGGGQPGATALIPGDNEVDTVATNNDSVQLPLAVPGLTCNINNAGASTLSIYANAAPNTNNASALDQLIAVNTNTKTAAASAITLATGHCTMFLCTTVGVWKQYSAS